MIEVTQFEEVTRIKTSLEVEGKPLYWVASYLVDGLLIDTGASNTAAEIAGYLEGCPPRAIVNTHYHEDHVGADRLLKQRFGVPVYAHPDSVGRINEVPELNPYQQYVWGYPEPVEVEPLGSAIATPRFSFDVLETPGHCPGHVALVEREKGWCFSGDIFITERPKVIRADEDAVGLMESMRMLASLPLPRLVLFTSMGKIIPDGRASLEACADYIDSLRMDVRELASQGFSAEQIRERLMGEGSSLAAMTGGHFSSDNLVVSLMA